MPYNPESPLAKTFFTVLGGIISGCVGLFIFHRKRIRDGKDLYGAIILQLTGRFSESRNVEAFYRDTKTELRDAVYRVRQFLPHQKVASLDRLWQEHRDIAEGELGESFRARVSEQAKKIFGEATQDYQEPKDVIDYYLREFHAFSA